MKNNRLPLLWLVGVLALTGCVTVVHVDPTTEGRAATGVDLSPVNQISASPALLAHTDSVNNLATLVFSTGKIFGQVFTGGADARGRLELISAHCEEMTSESWLIGKTNLTYSITVALDLDGRRHVLTATGTGSTHHSYPDAMREAVEKATANLAAQTRAVL